ncbi:unnamed protein product [marine sediment metagenome]|uniref:Uncharacterized protein n=1 Tax=marine sediment metagenome TaxID=412755 RepID=X1EXF5_9ZZZZ
MSKQIIAWDLSNLYKGIDDPKIVEDMKNIEKRLLLNFKI